MGFEKIEQSEVKNEKRRKSEYGSEEKSEDVESLQRTPPDLKASSKISLEVLINDVKSPEDGWPKEFFEAVQARFGRMPRFGWIRARTVFCGKFKKDISLESFKKKAFSKLSYKTEGDTVKSCKTQDNSLEISSLTDAKAIIHIRDTFLKCIREEESLQDGLSKRTRKVPNEKVDLKLLESLILVIEDYVRTKAQTSMTEVAKTIRCAQMAYELESMKPRVRSSWKDNIDKKILNLENLKNLLLRFQKAERLSREEKRKCLNFMSQEKLKLGNSLDITEATSRIMDKILIYKK